MGDPGTVDTYPWAGTITVVNPFSRFVAVVAIFLLTQAAALPASAHMGVSTSTPANGSTVTVAPDRLVVEFSVSVELDSAVARIRYIGGPDTPAADMNRRDVRTEVLTKTAGTGQGTEASFDLPVLPAGLYAIDWSVEEIGGHANNSVILFKVSEGESEEMSGQYWVPVAILVLVVGSLLVVVARRRRA